jgi:hypothetical protein
MKFRVEITGNNKQKRYVDISGNDEIDLAVALVQELGEGDTYRKGKYRREETQAPRDGDKIVIVVDGATIEKESLQAAKDHAATLSPDKSYSIISLEDPKGSRHSVLLEDRPMFEDEEI